MKTAQTMAMAALVLALLGLFTTAADAQFRGRRGKASLRGKQSSRTLQHGKAYGPQRIRASRYGVNLYPKGTQFKLKYQRGSAIPPAFPSRCAPGYCPPKAQPSEPVAPPVAPVDPTDSPVDDVDDELPVVFPGEQQTINGGGFGQQPGSVLLRIGPMAVPAQIVDWQPDGVTFQLPNVQVQQATPAQIEIMLANGSSTDPLAVQFAPPPAVQPAGLSPQPADEDPPMNEEAADANEQENQGSENEGQSNLAGETSESVAAADPQLAPLMGLWQAVADDADGQPQMVMLDVRPDGTATMSLPNGRGGQMTIQRRISMDGNSVVLSHNGQKTTLGTLVRATKSRIVLRRPEGMVTFTRR